MSMWYNVDAKVVITHIPTGIVGKSNIRHRNARDRVRLMTAYARSLLAARVARPTPIVKEVIRSYHLNPPLGITPFVGVGLGHRRKLAEGPARIEAMFNGRIPLPTPS